MGYKDKEKKREYQRKWIKNRRLDWLDVNGPCKKCGSKDNLEVDHVNPSEKKLNPTSLWSLSKEKREKELAKCQVLCHDCHKEKTLAYYKANAKHGTYVMRNTYNCKCDECLEYVREQKRQSRARIKARAKIKAQNNEC